MAWRLFGAKPLSEPMLIFQQQGPMLLYSMKFCQNVSIFIQKMYMMTSSNGNIFCVVGHLCGESTGYQWISLTQARDAELSCFHQSAPKQTVKQTLGTPSHTLWRPVYDVLNGETDGHPLSFWNPGVETSEPMHPMTPATNLGFFSQGFLSDDPIKNRNSVSPETS